MKKTNSKAWDIKKDQKLVDLLKQEMEKIPEVIWQSFMSGERKSLRGG